MSNLNQITQKKHYLLSVDEIKLVSIHLKVQGQGSYFEIFDYRLLYEISFYVWVLTYILIFSMHRRSTVGHNIKGELYQCKLWISAPSIFVFFSTLPRIHTLP